MLRLRPSAAAALDLPSERAQRLGRAAVASLYDELALAPKPGLVSFVDTGSHNDMDASTFMRSLSALRGYFPRIAMLGEAQAPFVALELLGLAAEQRMLQATGGINTHRGAIFTLGLLCAAAGSAGRPVSDAELRRTLLARWGEALEARRERGANSHGRLAAQRLGLRSAGDEAALGFPALFEHAVPALRQALGQGLNRPDALLQTLFEIMAVLDDTNLAHRGGAAGLGFARDQARAFLAAGGVRRPDAQAHALHIHRSFIARRLSPGGAADLLGAAALVVRLCHGA